MLLSQIRDKTIYLHKYFYLIVHVCISRKAALGLIVFCSRAWHRRRVIASRDVIIFSKVEDTEEENVVDAIPLFEVDFICPGQGAEDSSQEDHHKKSEIDKKADPQRQKFRNSLQIRTLLDGYNSGRAYYLKASSEEECSELIKKLTSSAEAAKKAKEAKTRFEESQERVRVVYRSVICQSITATMIIAVLPPFKNVMSIRLPCLDGAGPK